MRMARLARKVGTLSAVCSLGETAKRSASSSLPTTERSTSTSSWRPCSCPRGTERTIFDRLCQRCATASLSVNLLTDRYPQAQPLTTPALLLVDDDDDDDYLSCYEVMLPTPSPPSSPIRARFFPVGSAETEIPTSAVVKSCEDWLAGIKSGMPEIVIIEVCRSSAA